MRGGVGVLLAGLIWLTTVPVTAQTPDQSQAIPVAASVQVLHVAADGAETPLPNVEVRLVDPRSGDDARVLNADAAGVARLDLEAGSGQLLLATTSRDDLTFQADAVLSAEGAHDATIRVYDVTSDPSDLMARRVVTLVRLHERYLVVEQYWLLATSGHRVYRAGEDPTDGLEIVFPEGVEGIRLVEPDSMDESAAMVSEIGVTLRGPFGPPDALQESGPSMIVTFSLPYETARYSYEQTMPVPVHNAIVLVPQETTFDRFPRVDIELFVPPCDGTTDEGAYVCFPDEQSVREIPLMPDVQRREVHSGRGAAGSVLYFATDGWPVFPDPYRRGALLGILALGIALLGWIVWRRRPSGAAPLPSVFQLEQQRVHYLRGLRDLRSDYEAGLLPRSEFEMGDLLLRYRLEAVYQALGLPPDPDSERADDAEGEDGEAANQGREGPVEEAEDPTASEADGRAGS